MNETPSPSVAVIEVPQAPTASAPALPAVRPRLWPAALFIALQWLLMKVPTAIDPSSKWSLVGVTLGPAVGMFGFLFSWLVLSRIPWRDRWQALLACVVFCALVYPLCDPTFVWLGIAMFAPPFVWTAWVLWMLATPMLSWNARRIGLVVVLGLVWSVFPLLRWKCVDGWLVGDVEWRWQSDESQFLASAPTATLPISAEQVKLQPGDWPGFRGPNRDSRLSGVSINPNWDKVPPKLLWKKRIGPGWSSCVVIGKRLFTQYQHADDEVVACFDTETGDLFWTQKTPGRFWDNLGDAGPRATPTFHDGKIYAFGATGVLTCLNAANGERIWSHDVKEDAGAKLPKWGYSSSPLVMQGIVTVYAGAPHKAMLGYDAESGKLVWSAGEGRKSYSSPHPARLGGVDQVLLSTELGLGGYRPKTGELLWHHDWPTDGLVRCVQPAVVDDNTVLLGTGVDHGTRKISVKQKDDKWETVAGWTTLAIKPHFNDLVIHKGHAYGFDSGFFTCIDLARGKPKWRERGEGEGYGNGQVLLLVDQELLLVITEQKSKVCLIDASPAGHFEHPGRFQAFEGKTWNHPVIAHGKLFVRNAAWIACYELGQ